MVSGLMLKNGISAPTVISMGKRDNIIKYAIRTDEPDMSLIFTRLTSVFKKLFILVITAPSFNADTILPSKHRKISRNPSHAVDNPDLKMINLIYTNTLSTKGKT
jgi:hypothetical protein